MSEYIKRGDVIEKLTTVFKLQAETAKAIVAAIPPADVIVRVDDKMYDEFAEELRYTAMNRPFKGRKHDVELMLRAADALERKHGKWIYQFHEDEVGATCSECEGYAESFAKWIYDDGYRINYNYCPNCGADMREES